MGGTVYQPPLDISAASLIFVQQIQTAHGGWAAGKLGTSELDLLFFYNLNRKSKSAAEQAANPYPPLIVKNITVNAGLWSHLPSTDSSLDAWADLTLEALNTLDAVGVWNPYAAMQESQILYRYASQATRVKPRVFESFYSPQNQYTAHMTAGPIAVVSPFAASIESQWPKMREIFPPTGPAGPVWPANAQLVAIKAPYGPHLSTDPAHAWPPEVLQAGPQAAVTYLAQQVQASHARYAFVGIGALSLPLVAELKRRNIIAIHTGGGTQIMFGLKGKRWLNHSTISTFFNPVWVSPSPTETPTQALNVEGGCYW